MKRFISLFLACTLSISSAARAAEIRTVALSGQHAPGTPDGVNFDEFRFPVLNDAGQTAFLASGGPGPLNGVWSEGSGSLALVAGTGQQVPGMPDGVTVQISEGAGQVEFNNAGQTTFQSWITGAGIVGGISRGIWSDRSGSLAMVARSGTQAPGTPNGVMYGGSFTTYVVNSSGQTAFLAIIGGSGVDATNNRGFWSEGSGSLALVARTGDQAPGTPSGANFISFGTFLSLNDVGQTAFLGGLIGGGVNSTNNTGIWSNRSGSLDLVVRPGDEAPGTSSGVNFSSIRCCGVALNNAGHIAFRADLSGSGVDATNNRGIWSEGSGSLALVARTGDQAPGLPSGVKFGGFAQSFVLLNNADHTAFSASLSGNGVDSTNNSGLWAGAPGSLALVARTGDHAPGTPNGVVFGSIAGVRIGFNDAGQTAFRADLTGSGVDSTNDWGLWATDRSGQLQLIARKGDELEVAPGDFRTIGDSRFYQVSLGNSDGLNNLGQLAFWARFTDGSQGVFVSNRVAIPEPSGLALVGCFWSVALLVLSRRVTRERRGDLFIGNVKRRAPQRVEHHPKVQQSRLGGRLQDGERAGSVQSLLFRDAPPFPLIDQDDVCFQFLGQSNCLHFAGPQPDRRLKCCRRRFDYEPRRRRLGPTANRRRSTRALQFLHNFGRSANFPKQSRQHIDCADEDQVIQRGSIRNDDHRLSNCLKCLRSSSSSSAVGNASVTLCRLSTPSVSNRSNPSASESS